MVGKLIESRASLLDANVASELTAYTARWIDLYWNVDADFDPDIYYLRPEFPGRIYFKEPGIYSANYGLNSIISRSSRKSGNVEAAIFLNNRIIYRTRSFSFIKDKNQGFSTNNKDARFIVPRKDDYIEVQVRRSPRYRGSVTVVTDETSLHLKRERPLNDNGR